MLVYDVRGKSKEPIYQASVKTGKHSEPVWQVFWQVDEMQKALQFVSISSDGRVTLWTLSKSELVPEESMRLKLADSEKREEDVVMQAMAGGVCMDFNKVHNHSLMLPCPCHALYIFCMHWASRRGCSCQRAVHCSLLLDSLQLCNKASKQQRQLLTRSTGSCQGQGIFGSHVFCTCSPLYLQDRSPATYTLNSKLTL